MSAAETITSALGSRPVAASWRRLRRGLRILAFHDVPDADAFGAQLDELLAHHSFVSGADVGAALHQGAPLPPDAVWITFDDGDPSVVRRALPVLQEREVPATLYVCPGLLDPPSPPWWTVVERAGRGDRGAEVDGRRLVGLDLVRALKRVPDAERRRIVAGLDPVAVEGDPAPTTVDEVRAWLAAGQEVGNHTWDHPCLDRCTPDEQEAQVVRAHRWLSDLLGRPPRTFAYPNGDRTDHVAGLLADLGYDTVLLFDHDLAHPAPGGRELSRLRLDASAPLDRTRAVASGAHSDVMRAGARTSALARRVLGR